MVEPKYRKIVIGTTKFQKSPKTIETLSSKQEKQIWKPKEKNFLKDFSSRPRCWTTYLVKVKILLRIFEMVLSLE